mgnify:CR=1 FL=1
MGVNDQRKGIDVISIDYIFSEDNKTGYVAFASFYNVVLWNLESKNVESFCSIPE